MVTQTLPVFNDSPPQGWLKRQRHAERMEDFWKKSGAFLQVDRPDQRCWPWTLSLTPGLCSATWGEETPRAGEMEQRPDGGVAVGECFGQLGSR